MGSKGVLPDSTLKLTQADLAVRSLRVAIGGTPVGTLAQTTEGPIAFEYDASWLASGFSLSPFSLPLEGGLRRFTPSTDCSGFSMTACQTVGGACSWIAY